MDSGIDVRARALAWRMTGRTLVIPEEDRGPAWLRDYGHTDFGDIAADIAAMEEFAKKLAADVQNNYVPHLTGVTDAMLTKLPPPAGTFPELVDFMTAHQAVQDTTQTNVYNFAAGTNLFATAAKTISDEYRGADAFSRARVNDVEQAFKKTTTLDDSQSEYAGGDA